MEAARREAERRRDAAVERAEALLSDARQRADVVRAAAAAEAVEAAAAERATLLDGARHDAERSRTGRPNGCRCSSTGPSPRSVPQGRISEPAGEAGLGGRERAGALVGESSSRPGGRPGGRGRGHSERRGRIGRDFAVRP